MRKHNEGYALVLVLVTMVVLSLVSVALMSVGLRNLKSQKAVGERMQDKYVAQGEIEKLTAALTLADACGRTNETTPEGDHDKELSTWLTNGVILPWLNAVPEGTEATAELSALTIIEGAKVEGEPQKGTYSGILTLEVSHGSVLIKCELSVSGLYTLENPVSPSTVYTYKITPKEPTYREYVISRAEQGGDGQ